MMHKWLSASSYYTLSLSVFLNMFLHFSGKAFGEAAIYCICEKNTSNMHYDLRKYT